MSNGENDAIVNTYARGRTKASTCLDCSTPHYGDPEGLCRGCQKVRRLEENLKDYLETERRLKRDFDDLQRMLQAANKSVRLERSALQRALGERSMRKLRMHAPHLAIVNGLAKKDSE